MYIGLAKKDNAPGCPSSIFATVFTFALPSPSIVPLSIAAICCAENSIHSKLGLLQIYVKLKSYLVNCPLISISLKTFIKSSFWFIRISSDYIVKVIEEYFIIRFYLKPLVEKACLKANHNLTKDERKKTLNYYPLLTICGNADNYVLLKQRTLSKEEKIKLSLMSAMATLFDDLLDEEGWHEEKVRKTFGEGKALEEKSSKARLLFYLEEEFKKLNIPADYSSALEEALQAQYDSLLQINSNLSQEETITLSRNKNGKTSLIVCSLIDGDWNENEKKIIYQSGVLGQLMNDIFDTYKDHQEGIYTIMSKISSVLELQLIYLDELTALYDSLKKTELSEKQKYYLMRRLAPIFAFGLVGIQRLYELEKKYGNVDKFSSLKREELIFDMAKWKNRFLYMRKMEEIAGRF